MTLRSRNTTQFKVAMRNFQFLVIVAPPLDKSGRDTSAYSCKELFFHVNCQTCVHLCFTSWVQSLFSSKASVCFVQGWPEMQFS